MIYHEVIYAFGVDYPAYIFDQVIFEGLLDRIEKRDFFIYYEIGVISRPSRVE